MKNRFRRAGSFRIQILQNRLHDIDVHQIRHVHDGFGYDENRMESQFNSNTVVGCCNNDDNIIMIIIVIIMTHDVYRSACDKFSSADNIHRSIESSLVIAGYNIGIKVYIINY